MLNAEACLFFSLYRFEVCLVPLYMLKCVVIVCVCIELATVSACLDSKVGEKHNECLKMRGVLGGWVVRTGTLPMHCGGRAAEA